MKKLLTMTFAALVALSAHAEPTQGNTKTLAGGRVIYNVSPLPPIQSGSRVTYPAGNVKVSGGRSTACHNELATIGSRDASQKRFACDPRTDAQIAEAKVDAAAMAALTPAAGGSPEMNQLSDKYMRMDSRADLRSDRKLGY